MAKGCPLLEHIDFGVEGTAAAAAENGPPLHVDELAALASLHRLRSAFIHINIVRFNPRTIMPADTEELRAALDAIVDQGLLEVRRTWLRLG